ncbi:MAG: peptidylprolyl isomerase [Nitrospirota bacterium]
MDEKAVLTEEQLRAYYSQNRKKFLEPEKIRVFHIMIGVDPSSDRKGWDDAEALAEEVASRARAGEDFSTLAATYSKDAYRVKGGDMGYIHRGRLDQAIEEAAFSLEDGQIGGPVKTMHGYSIVKVGAKKPEALLSFDDARETIKRHLENLERKTLFENLMESLRKRSKIEIFEPELMQ